MSKAFTKESDGDADDHDDVPALPLGQKNYMTPEGHATLRQEYQKLLHEDRPKIVEVVAWAAGNGDRSENGDYIYGKKRLREIDRRLRYLGKRLESAEVVDPALQKKLKQIFFGATVTYVREDNTEMTVKIVGVDEADMQMGKISWFSPVARALMKAKVGDEVKLKTPAGVQLLEVLKISYGVGV